MGNERGWGCETCLRGHRGFESLTLDRGREDVGGSKTGWWGLAASVTHGRTCTMPSPRCDDVSRIPLQVPPAPCCSKDHFLSIPFPYPWPPPAPIPAALGPLPGPFHPTSPVMKGAGWAAPPALPRFPPDASNKFNWKKPRLTWRQGKEAGRACTS